MAKQPTGELRPTTSGWEARITLRGRHRGSFPLTSFAKADEEGARARCAAMAAIATRMRRAGRLAELPELLKLAGRARPGRPWDEVMVAVDQLCVAGGTAPLNKIVTFSDFAGEWTSGKLRARFPDHVPEKKAKTVSEDKRMLRMYVEPLLKDVPIADVTLSHADEVMRSLPVHLSSHARRQVAQVLRRVLALAVYPGRHRTTNPIPSGWLPKVRNAKALTCLYPAEDRKLLACVEVDESGSPKVPLIRRLFFGVLAREGLRRGELGALRWRDLDLERGRIRLDENKTDDPRSWALDPGVARALQAWRERFAPNAEPDDHVFAEEGTPLYVDQLAAALQGDLEAAGVDRAELFERSAHRRPIRVHDLRATFVTVALANGKTETWVADRTGHRSSVMLNAYRRAARTWAELDLGALTPLDSAIPGSCRSVVGRATEKWA